MRRPASPLKFYVHYPAMSPWQSRTAWSLSGISSTLEFMNPGSHEPIPRESIPPVKIFDVFVGGCGPPHCNLFFAARGTIRTGHNRQSFSHGMTLRWGNWKMHTWDKWQERWDLEDHIKSAWSIGRPIGQCSAIGIIDHRSTYWSIGRIYWPTRKYWWIGHNRAGGWERRKMLSA